MIDIIKESNRERYNTGTVVDRYMQEPYHVLRLQKAFHLLKSYLDRNFQSLSNSEIQILEIAGSVGYMSTCLSNEGYSILLTDFELTPLNVAVEKNSNLRIALMDAAEPFPFKDNTFHAIYAGDIIEHLFDTSLFLNECYRCLKSNGILLLTTPNLASLEDRIRFLFGKSPRQINPTHEFLYLHIRPFTYQKIKELLTQVGFYNFSICTNLVRIKIGNFKKDSLLLAKLFPSLGRSLIVAACAQKEVL